MVRLLAQARKYKAAITFAHQHLDQLSSANRAGILANTGVKLAGGISAKDASALAPEYRTTASVLLGYTKTANESSFALFAKNITPSAMKFIVPLGYVESIDRLTTAEVAGLLDCSRREYGQAVEVDSADDGFDPADEISTPVIAYPVAHIEPELTSSIEQADSPASSPSPMVHRKEGGGGVRHSELERMVKELGEAAGYRASIEETILDGAGRVDVVLRRDAELICIEISVTTTREHELLNVKKCLEFGATKVLVVAAVARHRISLERYIAGQLGDAEKALVEYLLPDDLPEYIAKLAPESVPIETVVRGYRVVSKVVGAATRISIKNILRDPPLL